MPAQNRIQILIEAKNNATAQLSQVGGALDSLASIAIGGGVAFAGMQFARAVIDLAQLGAQAERTRDSFEQLYDLDPSVALSKLRRAAQGAVSDTDLLMAANRAQMLQVASTTEELARLMEVARVRGRAMGLSTTQAFNDLVTGIGRASPMILDNLGIITGGVRTYNEYAASIGKTADTLTDLEKKQALLKKVFSETQPLLEAQVEGQVDAATGFEASGAQMENLRTEIGRMLAAAGGIVSFWAQGVGAAAEYLSRVNDIREAHAELDEQLTRAALIEFVPAFRPEQLGLAPMRAEALAAITDRAGSALQRLQIEALRLDEQFRANEITFDQYAERMRSIGQAAAILGDDLATTFSRSRGEIGLTRDEFNALSDRVVGLVQDFVSGKIGPDEFNAALQGVKNAAYASIPPLSAYADVAGNDVFRAALAAAGAVDQLTLAFRNQAAAVQEAYDISGAAQAAHDVQMERRAKVAAWASEMELKRLQAEEERLEGITVAERDYRYAVADTAGQLSILNDELADLVPGTEAYYDKLTEIARLQKSAGGAAAKEYNEALAEMRSLVEQVLQPTAVTWADVLATDAGVYVDKWDEAARRAADIANRGLQSPWAAFFEIPPEIMARGEDHVKAWAAGLAEDIRIGLHPEMIDWEAFDRMLMEAAERKRAREAMVAEGVRRAAALGLGLTTAEIGVTLGVSAPATATVAALEEGVRESALGTVVAETFELQIKAERTRFVTAGEMAMAGFTEGLRAGMTPGMAEEIALWMAPFVADYMQSRVN